jgi:tRNA A-37 threonylcarbamoyl transferase component Bud32
MRLSHDTSPLVEAGTPGTRSTGVRALWHAVISPIIASLMASPVLLCAERIADLVAGLAPTGTKCIGLGERIVSLTNLLRPIAPLGAEILETSFFTSAFDKLQTLLISIDMFLRTALHLLSVGFEVELETTVAGFIPRLDSHIDEIKTLEDRRCELLRQEDEFHHTLQQQYVDDPPLRDLHDDRSLISQGRFGVTCRMINTTDRTIYVVKRFRLALLATHGVTVSVLVQESKSLRALFHPHVARMLTTFLSKEERFFNIAMELFEEGTLADKLSCVMAPSELEILDWARQMASALNYMHAQGVLHHDLKPENLMLTRTGEVKLAGFELPCIRAISAAGYTVYTSFERTMGLPYDDRDDVWAVGCILLELLCRDR